jgi:hypothetical protein
VGRYISWEKGLQFEVKRVRIENNAAVARKELEVVVYEEII